MTAWARAVAAGTLATTLGLAGHGIAGAAPIEWPRALVILAVVTAMIRLLQPGPGQPWRTAVLLATTQPVVHILASAGHVGHAHAGLAMAEAPSHAHATGLVAGTLRRSAIPTGPMLLETIAAGAHSLVADPVMAIAHAVAAAGLGWWLAQGERIAIAALAILTEFLRPLPGAQSSPTAPQPVVRLRAEVTPRSRWLTWFSVVVARRGPPLTA